MEENIEEKNNSVAAKAENRAMVGFVLGLALIIQVIIVHFVNFPISFILDLLAPVAGFVFSIMGLKSKRNKLKIIAIVGLIFSIIYLVYDFSTLLLYIAWSSFTF